MSFISSIRKALGKGTADQTEAIRPPESGVKNDNMPRREEREESEASLQPECPVYEYIKSHTHDGRLADDFQIPWIQSGWAPGAQDGVFLYHMMPLQPDPDREEMILKALKMMSDEANGEHIDAVFSIFEEIDKNTSIVRLFDEIIGIIAANQADLSLGNLLNFGDWLICNGISLLSVKLGLSVLSAFTVPFVEEVMTEFGVYDEFTYYAARVLPRTNWKNGNDELYHLAKNVHGWGRIHAVEYLRPDTPEIRDWLLYEGADNEVMPQYSADICLQKAGAEKRLDSALSAREYEAIGKLIQIALESGPRPGITDEDRILPKFLDKGKEFPIDPALRQTILTALKKEK